MLCADAPCTRGEGQESATPCRTPRGSRRSVEMEEYVRVNAEPPMRERQQRLAQRSARALERFNQRSVGELAIALRASGVTVAKHSAYTLEAHPAGSPRGRARAVDLRRLLVGRVVVARGRPPVRLVEVHGHRNGRARARMPAP